MPSCGHRSIVFPSSPALTVGRFADVDAKTNTSVFGGRDNKLVTENGFSFVELGQSTNKTRRRPFCAADDVSRAVSLRHAERHARRKGRVHVPQQPPLQKPAHQRHLAPLQRLALVGAPSSRRRSSRRRRAFAAARDRRARRWEEERRPR
mmetsp:Transcript_3768/g.11670  ORF Transcript_3768/g.11670 Transcript_3768/m.11670 type:complete len:150 (-) Transcript_3768:574-1023(-)